MKKIHVLALMIVLWAGTVNAQKPQRAKIVCGPYVQCMTETSFTVIWTTDVDAVAWVEVGLGYYDFKDRQDEVEQRIGAYLLERYNTLSISRKYPIAKIHVTMPWRRMFEIGMQIDWA